MRLLLLATLGLAPAFAWGESYTFLCSLKSHDDSLEFTISDPTRPSPVIIGVNGSNPLERMAFLTPDREHLIVLIEELAAGGAHLNNLMRDGDEYRAVHLRWGNPDPSEAFYGRCVRN